MEMQLVRQSLKQPGKRQKILLSSEKTVIHADGQELCFIPITLTDANGIWKPAKEARLSIHMDGPPGYKRWEMPPPKPRKPTPTIPTARGSAVPLP